MRNVPPQLASCTSLCWVWILRLRDQSVLGFTDHDRALTFLGVSCNPQSGLTPKAASNRSGMDTDNGQVQGILDGTEISAEDILEGRFTNARLDRYR